MHKNTFSRSGLLNTEKTKKSSIKFNDNINDNNPFDIESNKDIRKLKKNKKLEKEYTKQINQYNSPTSPADAVGVSEYTEPICIPRTASIEIPRIN